LVKWEVNVDVGGKMPLGWLLDYGSVTLLANQKSTLSQLVESICMSVSTVDATKKCT